MFNTKELIHEKTFFLLVAMLIASVTAMAQNVSISGKVADANGEPLIGVSILVQGTTTGTMTDIDGNFALDVPAGAILCRNIQDMVIEKSGFEENAKFFNEKAKPAAKHQSNFAKKQPLTYYY